MSDWKRALIGVLCIALAFVLWWYVGKSNGYIQNNSSLEKTSTQRAYRVNTGSATVNVDTIEVKSGQFTDIYRTMCVRPNGSEIGVVVHEHAQGIGEQITVLTSIQLNQPDGRPMTCTFNDSKPVPERSSL